MQHTSNHIHTWNFYTMKHFKHGKTKTPFKYNTWPWKSKTSLWRTRNSVVSMIQLPKEPDVLTKENQTVRPKLLAWLGCLAVKGSWVRDAQKRKSPQPANQMPRQCPGCKGELLLLQSSGLHPPALLFYRNDTSCSHLAVWKSRTRSSDSCVLASAGLWDERCKHYPNFTNSRTELKRTSVTGREHPHPDLKSLGVLSESLPHTA